jgi:hypothetical protein
MRKNILCILLATSVSIGAMVLAGEKNAVKDNGSIEKHAQVTQDNRMSRGGTFDDDMLTNSKNNENVKVAQGEESSETTTIKVAEESIEIESEPAPKQEEQREVEALDWWSEAQYICS